MKDRSLPGSDPAWLGQDFFEFLLKNTPDQVYFKDREGRFLRVSRAVAQYMDVADPNDLIGRTDFDFWSPETAAAAAADERRIMETGEPLIGKVERLVHPDGRVTWDYTTKLPLRGAGGEIIGICGINKDFTAIKEMEDMLAAERNRLQETTRELEAKNEQLEADLRMARDIQEALLPRDYPRRAESNISGHSTLAFAHCYRPAAAVGGDFFDIFPLSPHRAGVFICDVMGHGLRAALITAIIRTLLEELRPVMMNAGRFLSALNLRLRAILERVEEPFVATAFYAVADTARSEVRFANAGHPVPVRLRRQDGTAERLIAPEQQGGPALGIVDGAIYPSFSSPFEKQDCIVLFTDGLYEAESPDGQAYGLKALIASLARCARLPAQELFNEVLAEIGRFAARPDFDDDVCLVAMEQTDS